MLKWLRELEACSFGHDEYSICMRAYKVRNDPEMRSLKTLGGENVSVEEPGPGFPGFRTHEAFRKAHHTIGRLAEHIRAVKQVLEDSARLQALELDLLDVFHVAAVPLPVSVAAPTADGHTTLEGILKRMLGVNDARFPELLAFLYRLDDQVHLEDALLERFNKNDNKNKDNKDDENNNNAEMQRPQQQQQPRPCVHAEIQALHHFHDNGFVFVGGDPFVATSKPACFCCKLYFRHHPAGFVEPDSHEKIYPNWGMIHLPGGCDDPAWMGQRPVLNSVINDVAKEVIRDIERRRSLYFENPDSVTGLTLSSLTFRNDESTDSDDCFEHDSEAWEGDTSDFGSDTDGGIEA